MIAKQEKALQILWHMVFFAAAAFLLWKCQYGYAFSDEAFYLTIPYRMSMGDRLLLQEWHPSQLSSFLLYPLVKIYLTIYGDTIGIFLHFRILYTLTWSLASYFFYRRLRRISLTGSMLGSMIFLLYAPFGIMALSYNSLGILLMINSGVLMASSFSRRPAADASAGLSFAGAVMCCPYLLLVYAAGTGIILILAIRTHERKSLRRWLCFSAGCCILLVLFLSYLLSQGSLHAYRQVLPEIMRDPEHTPLNLMEKCSTYFSCLLTANRAVIPCLAGFLAACFIGRRKNSWIGFLLVCFLSGVLLYAFKSSYYNNIMLALNLAGLYCGLNGAGKEIKAIFRWLWLPGAAYTFCLHLSSNQRLFAISSASAVMAFASPVLMILYLRELQQKQGIGLRIHRRAGKQDGNLIGRRIAAGACALLLTAQLAYEVRLRYGMVFGEPGMAEMNTRIEEGAEKGLLTNTEQAAFAAMTEADASVIRLQPDASDLLILDPNSVPMYLSAGLGIASYSAWLSGLTDLTLQRLKAYEALNPEKKPDLLYVQAENLPLAAEYLNRGYTTKMLPSGAWLLIRSGAESVIQSTYVPDETEVF